MADTPKVSLFTRLRTGLVWFFNWVYFLRFPILTAAALAGLPYLGLASSVKTLLASLFVTDGWGVFLVSLVAFTTCWAILVTWRLIRSYGTGRFKLTKEAAEQPETRFKIGGWQAFFFALLALPLTIAVIYKTGMESAHTSLLSAAMFTGLGLVVSLILFFAAVLVQLLVNAETGARQLYKELFIVSWLPVSLIDWIALKDPAQTPRRSLRKFLRTILGEGFFDDHEGRFLAGHGLAASLLFVTLVVFILTGVFTNLEMPALFFVVLLLMLLCWVLSGLSFVLDRFRVPVMLILLAVIYLSHPNYFYGIQNDRELKMLTPEQVLGATKESPKKVIVVATEGGGIQAAAWTAQVLAGIQKERPDFANAVRLISSVSGGSVGSFFFVNSYNPQAGAPDPDALELVVKMAEGNSLDDVARGLVYHDFFNLLLFGFWPFGADRGIALEDSWGRSCEKVCAEYLDGHKDKKQCPVDCSMKGTLAGWSEDVLAGKRPANVFNATVVENGDRLLAGNTDRNSEKEPLDTRGRLNLAKLLKGKDIQADTAARLSATFPYVSPAARSREKTPDGALLHLVDGGYYDNYGMTSIVEWLNNALEDGLISEVLVIQIQSFPEIKSNEKPSGYISQSVAPVETLLNIRTAAQASHKEIEFDLLREKWNIKTGEKKQDTIQSANFRFCCLPSSDGKKNCYDPPLTWKLTDAEKAKIGECWTNGSQNNPIQTVVDFLNKMKSDPTTAPNALQPEK